MGLVRHIAGTYPRWARDDLAGEGALALVKAARSWDGRIPFHAYAGVCIRRRMSRWYAKFRNVQMAVPERARRDPEPSPDLSWLYEEVSRLQEPQRTALRRFLCDWPPCLAVRGDGVGKAARSWRYRDGLKKLRWRVLGVA